MTEVKLEGTLKSFFEHMEGQKIEGVGTFDDELVIFLEDGSEVCIRSDGNLTMAIHPKVQYDN